MDRPTLFQDTFEVEDVIALHSGDNALLCEVDDEEEWIPYSQIAEDSEVTDEGDEGSLIVSWWLAEKKGWV